jgi:hypothetical protein
MSLSPFLKDLIERVVRTFLAAVFSGLATVASTGPSTPEEIKVVVFTLVTTSFTAAIGTLAKTIGSKDTASILDVYKDFGFDDVE